MCNQKLAYNPKGDSREQIRETGKRFWELIKEYLEAGATTQQAIQAAKEELE